MLYPLPGNTLSQLHPSQSLSQLEHGSVIFLPEFSFYLTPEEQRLYNIATLTTKNKNISYDHSKNQLSGLLKNHPDHLMTKTMMARYLTYAQNLVNHLFPNYQTSIQTARTSFRPVEIAGRTPASYRKDDTRLHVDAFPATPNQGKRLLRVFCNINPNGQPRKWLLGEPFTKVVERFAPQLKLPWPHKKYILKWSGITKSLRSDYDELMLQLHDTMKADLFYQKNVLQQTVHFPAHTTWIVFTDQVSHAALTGQFCLEQTFLLPIEAMQHIETAPFKILQKALQFS